MATMPKIVPDLLNHPIVTKVMQGSFSCNGRLRLEVVADTGEMAEMHFTSPIGSCTQLLNEYRAANGLAEKLTKSIPLCRAVVTVRNVVTGETVAIACSDELRAPNEYAATVFELVRQTLSGYERVPVGDRSVRIAEEGPWAVILVYAHRSLQCRTVARLVGTAWTTVDFDDLAVRSDVIRFLHHRGYERGAIGTLLALSPYEVELVLGPVPIPPAGGGGGTMTNWGGYSGGVFPTSARTGAAAGGSERAP